LSYTLIYSGRPVIIFSDNLKHVFIVTGISGTDLNDLVYFHDSGTILADDGIAKGDQVNNSITWKNFKELINNGLSIDSDVSLCYVNSGHLQKSSGNLSFQINPGGLTFQNKVGLTGSEVRQIVFDWDGKSSNNGYKYVKGYQTDSWYPIDTNLGYKATQADEMFIVPFISNSSFPQTPITCKVILEIIDNNEIIVISKQSENIQIPGTGKKDGDYYNPFSSGIEMKDFAIGNYRCELKLINAANNLVEDKMSINFAVASSSIATGFASVSLGVALSPATVISGNNFTTTFTLKETKGASITFESIVCGITNTNNTWVRDMEFKGSITLPANGTLNYSSTLQWRTSDPIGTYRAWARGKVEGGDWIDFTVAEGVNPKEFQVISNVSNPGSFSLTLTPECSGTTSQIKLNWTASSNATSYDIYRNGSYYDNVASGIQYINSGNITSGTTYSYYVVAKNTAGNTNNSNGTQSTVAQNCSTTQTPTITTTSTSIPDFGNIQVNTNSSPQSFTVSGSNLTSDVSLLAPTGFEIAKTSDSGFGSTLSLTQSGGTVSSTTIYVRFNPTSEGAKSGNISITSTGAETKNVAVSGTGTTPPSITVPSNSLPDFGSVQVNTTSTAQSFTVSGSNLTADVSLSAPAGFEISKSSGSGYGSSLSLAQSGGTVSSTTIYVRFNPISEGAKSGNISITSTGAETKNVAVSGTGTNPPSITVPSNSLTDFGSVQVNTTSTAQSFTVSGSNLTADVSLLAPAGFEISKTSDSGFGSSLILTQSDGTVSSTTIYVRFNPTIEGAKSGNISITSTGAETKNVAVSGTGTTPPKITVPSNSLPDFGSVHVNTPSTAQSFTVSGSNLTADVSLLAPAGFEISKTSDFGFGSSLSLTQSGGSVSSTTIYVRFNPSSEGAKSGNVSITSTGAETKNVEVSGTGTTCTPPVSPNSATASNTTITSGQSTTLQVNGGALNSASEWVWFTEACGVTKVGTGATLTVSPTNTTTYYVQAKACGDSTTCRSVTITVNQLPKTPVLIKVDEIPIYISEPQEEGDWYKFKTFAKGNYIINCELKDNDPMFTQIVSYVYENDSSTLITNNTLKEDTWYYVKIISRYGYYFNIFSGINYLGIGGSVNEAIEFSGEGDWYEVALPGGSWYDPYVEGSVVIQTFGSTDTYIEFYSQDRGDKWGYDIGNFEGGRQNDNNGADINASITLTGWSYRSRYYIKVGANSGITGPYTIKCFFTPTYSEYLFEETSDTTVIDSKGPNNGTIINNAARVDGATGGGVGFTGTEYINLGESFGENVTNEVTLSAWIKPATTGNYQGVIMHGGPNIDTYALYIRPDSKEIGFKTSGTSNDWVSIKNVVNLWDGDWHQLAVTYNGTQKVIYLDSIAIITVNATGKIESGAGYNLLIGAGRDVESPTLLYKGLIDEVRIYNYALSKELIYELYNRVSPAFSEYLFEETSGTTVIDSKGPNNGTIINNTARVTGVIGGGLEFTGTEYITLGQSFGENVKNEVTLSAWVKPATSGNYQGVIMHGGSNIDTYALYIRPDSKEIGFKTSGTTNDWVSIKNVANLWDGDWHQLAVTYNGAQKVIYLDSVALITVDATGTIESGAGYNLLVGAGRDIQSPTLLYKGLMDEVRIYNYALTGAQIAELYHLVISFITKVEIVKNIETIKVYPNPTNGHLNIEGLPEGEKTEIALYNINSKLVKKQIEYSSLTQMDISDVVSGVYLLVFNNKFNNAVKIVKR
jgi:hypothetical protein